MTSSIPRSHQALSDLALPPIACTLSSDASLIFSTLSLLMLEYDSCTLSSKVQAPPGVCRPPLALAVYITSG